MGGGVTRRTVLLVATVASLLLGLLPVTAQAEPTSVLVWSGTYGFRHPSITSAQLAFVQLDLQHAGFTVEFTENPADLSAATLADVDVLVWLMSTGKPPLTEQQRAEVTRWAACGGGTMAFHAAADSNYGWAEYAELLGAQFDSHPFTGRAQLNVEHPDHQIMQGWSDTESFTLDDEWYRWRGAKRLPGMSLPRSLDDVEVLLSLEETTVPASIQGSNVAYEDDQPIAWTKTFRGGGRVYYNNMGHNDATWSLAPFRTSIVNGIDWVDDVQLDSACAAGDQPLPPAAAPPAARPDTIGRPCDVAAVTPRTGPWESSGTIRTLTAAGDAVQVASGVAGNLGWGAQGYVLDLSALGAAAADVTVDLQMPSPLDDYDLSVTAPWGWYGSDAPQGAVQERVVVEDAPHCALLWVYADNLYGITGGRPTLRLTIGGAR